MLAAMEGGRHTLTAWGILGDNPPTDPDGFEAFLSTLAFPDIADAVRGRSPSTTSCRSGSQPWCGDATSGCVPSPSGSW